TSLKLTNKCADRACWNIYNLREKLGRREGDKMIKTNRIHTAWAPATLFAVSLLLVSTAMALAADPICKKEDIRLVNSMREIAQPYHANLDKGGRLFATWAGIPGQY